MPPKAQVPARSKDEYFGGKPGPGRPKGKPNKVTIAVREMVIKALDQAGGVEYLVRQAKDNPNAFMQLVGKVIPLQVAGDPDNPLMKVTVVELVAPEMRKLPQPEILLTGPRESAH